MGLAKSFQVERPWRALIERLASGRIQRRPTRRLVSVLDRVLFGPRCGVWVVRFGEEILLVGVSEEKVELLRHYPDRSESAVEVLQEEDE